MDKLYKCKTCNFVSSKRQYLYAHKKKHLEEYKRIYKFYCDVCEVPIKDNFNVKKHCCSNVHCDKLIDDRDKNKLKKNARELNNIVIVKKDTVHIIKSKLNVTK